MSFEAQIPAAVGPEHWFAQAWAAGLSEVAEALDLGEGAGPLEVRTGAASPGKWLQWPKPLWHTQAWTLAQDAQVWIGCPAELPRALWAHIGGAEGPAAENEALETFREMLNQSAAGAAGEATKRLGALVQASAVEESSAPSSGWAVELSFETCGQTHSLVVVGNVAIAKALNPPAMDPPPPSEPRIAAPVPAPASSRQSAQPQADPLELIREVSMELAVSFGGTTLPLANVLELSSGAIVELNRSVSDPVEVLVNGSIIARGDVVVVDGNYGVRITEIVSRRDRVRSMI